MFCANCGEKIDDGVKFCMKCGTAIGGMPNVPVIPLSQQPAIVLENNSTEVKKKYNIMALIGFLLGLVSLLLSFLGIVGILACVFSGVGLGKFNAETEKNKWMAVLGIILGILSIGYALVQLYG